MRFHVDDMLSSHVDKEVNDQFHVWAEETYGKLKKVTVTRGKIHQFLGMVLDFSMAGECHVIQNDHVSDMIKGWPEDIVEKDVAITPASNNLFEVGDSGLLSDNKREIFHKTVAKGIFVAGRSRPDITPTILV